MKLDRDEFFGHDKIQKLTNQINKRALSGFVFLVIKDKELIKLLKNNIEWLDYVGISFEAKSVKGNCVISWRDLK